MLFYFKHLSKFEIKFDETRSCMVKIDIYLSLRWNLMKLKIVWLKLIYHGKFIGKFWKKIPLNL